MTKSFALAAGAALAFAASVSAACSQYILLETRGTGEPQGPSAAFRTMNANVLAQKPGGSEYDTVYFAGGGQDSSAGTADIVRDINAQLAANPATCFVLEGYSQGAAATVDAMYQLGRSGAAFDAVKAVFLVGNPRHAAGLKCNVDTNDGRTTYSSTGVEAFENRPVPPEWVAKTLDVCALGDGICSMQTGGGFSSQHVQYISDGSVQSMGTNFVLKRLG